MQSFNVVPYSFHKCSDFDIIAVTEQPMKKIK